MRAVRAQEQAQQFRSTALRDATRCSCHVAADKVGAFAVAFHCWGTEKAECRTRGLSPIM